MPRPKCLIEDELVHKGFGPTGRSEVDRKTLVRWELWKCQCGKKTVQVTPGTKKDW